MFKVGDKVRYKDKSHQFSVGHMAHGQVSTVSSVSSRYGGGDVLTLDEFGSFTWGGDSFEVVHPHKHAAFIKAWADGAKIQVRTPLRGWIDIVSPSWNAEDYRIKPEPKPDSIILMQITKSVAEGHQCAAFETETPNVKCIFDGDTGKLKVVELIS